MSSLLVSPCGGRRLRRAGWTVLAALGVVLSVAAPAHAVVSFDPVVSVEPGAAPYAVVVADFDGDGVKDLVTANATAGSVSVLLGTGGGGFGPPVRYATGATPYAVAVGDLDGDGRQDLVTANYGSSTVSVLVNTGSGSFAAARSFATGRNPHSVAVGDLDGDGVLDLVTANLNANTVSVLLGTGGGGFAAATNYATGSGPASAVVADVDGDGRLDIVTANRSTTTVSLLLGTGGGGFAGASSLSVGLNPASVAVADLDGDGRRDIVTANSGSDDVSVLYGGGGASFSLATNLPVQAGPSSVEVADLDADGRLDIVVANGRSDSVSVLLGGGYRAFVPAVSFAAGDGARTAAVADVDGDGRLDVAVANVNAQDVWLLLAARPAALALSASGIVFPDQGSGTLSPARAVTVRNSGERAVRLSSATVSGTSADDFIKTGDGCGGETIPAGGSCSIAIRFAPSSLGPVGATLTIHSDAPDGPHEVGLSGVGIAASSGPQDPSGATGADGLAGTAPPVRRRSAPRRLRVACMTRPARQLGSDRPRAHPRPRGMVCRFALEVRARAIRLDGRLSRGRTVHAFGGRAVRTRRLVLTMPVVRRITPGRYRLTITITNRSGARTVMRKPIALAKTP